MCIHTGVADAKVQKGFSTMNFHILAAQIMPRGRAIAMVAAGLATVVISGAQAQTPATKTPAKAAPAASSKAPAKAAAPAPAGAQPAEQQVQLIYAPWTKFCMKGQDANAKQVCFTGKDGRIESGQPVIAAVIIEPEGEPKKILRVTLPLGMQLVHGTRIIVDSNSPQQSPYAICFANGCMSDYELSTEMLGFMKKGQNLIVQAINANGAPLTLPLPLAEFAKAYDGPPTDPKVFEETQKKLQEELQKRAAEARQKLENAAPSAAAK